VIRSIERWNRDLIEPNNSSELFASDKSGINRESNPNKSKQKEINPMAHLILENDSAYRPANTPVSWHGLETPVDGEILTSAQIPGVAYDVTKEKLLTLLNSNSDQYVLSGSNCSDVIIGTIPQEDGTMKKLIIATSSPEYHVISNRMIFEKAMEAFEKAGIPVSLSYCLTMDNGKKVSYAFAIKGTEEFNTNNGDVTKLFIIVTGSHDKTMGVRLFGSMTRVVCNNTLQMALRGEKKGINHTFFHNAKGVLDFQHLPQLIDSIYSDSQKFVKLTEQMGNFALAQMDAFYLAIGFLAEGKKEISTQIYNQAGGITYLFKAGKGNHGRSFYDLLNGVTEFYTTGDGSGKKVSLWAKAVSADYGNAASKKAEFLQTFQDEFGNLVSEDQIFKMLNIGKTLAAAYEAKNDIPAIDGFNAFRGASNAIGSMSGAATPLALPRMAGNGQSEATTETPEILVEVVTEETELVTA
jgi:hypothetical protein